MCQVSTCNDFPSIYQDLPYADCKIIIGTWHCDQEKMVMLIYNIMFMCRPLIILLLFKKKVLSTLVLYRASLVHLKQHLLHSSITWKYKYRCSTQFDSPVQSPRITHTARLEKWPTRLQWSHSRYILLHVQSLQTYMVESLHSELLELLKIRGERQKKITLEVKEIQR